MDSSLSTHHHLSSSIRSYLHTGINSSSSGGGGSFAATVITKTGRERALCTTLIESKRRKHWRIFSDPVACLPDTHVHEKTGTVQVGEPYDLRCHRLQRTMVREQWSWLDRSLGYVDTFLVVML